MYESDVVSATEILDVFLYFNHICIHDEHLDRLFRKVFPEKEFVDDIVDVNDKSIPGYDISPNRVHIRQNLHYMCEENEYNPIYLYIEIQSHYRRRTVRACTWRKRCIVV